MKLLSVLAALGLSAGTAMAADAVTYTVDQSPDDVLFSVESAILDRGLVIDSTSHVGDMLERTRADVGSDIVLYNVAKVFSFCSAQVSREVMEADPMNIAFCPYGIFVMQTPDMTDQTIVGYRSFPEGEMQKVQKLLDEIVQAAIAE